MIIERAKNLRGATMTPNQQAPCEPRRRYRQDSCYHNNFPSSHHSSPSSASGRIMESHHHRHLSLHKYLVGLMIDNAGCNELILIRDDPVGPTSRHDSIVPPVVINTETWRFRSKSQEERGRTKERCAISNSCKGSTFVDDHCDGDEGDSVWNNQNDFCCEDCTMNKELTLCGEEGCKVSVNARMALRPSRKKHVPPYCPPPPPTQATISARRTSPCSSMDASPSSVLFHPYNARHHRPYLRRMERATTIPTTRFDMRQDLRYDGHHSCRPRSELRTDGPPCRPQRRPSIRNLDTHG